MTVTITPRKLNGMITPPPSKSQAHRLLIAAALSGGVSTISNTALSQDIAATVSCLRSMGTDIIEYAGSVKLHGLGGSMAQGSAIPQFDCGESGSTLRFLIPVALAVCGGGVFTGRGRLMERPQGPYFRIFEEKGIFYEQKGGVLTVQGRLTPGEYRLPGDVSSQFITGLLYALPLLAGDSEIVVTTPLESRGYVAMTLDVLKQFGVEVTCRRDRFFVPGGQSYCARDLAVEADWSQAGFWYAAQGIGNSVVVTGMNEKSCQGDRAILDWGCMLRGAPLTGGITLPIFGKTGAVPKEGQVSGRRAVSIDVSQCPDLVPPLAAWGALTPGCDLYVKNAGRLRIKESDRLSSVTQVLNTLGARIEEYSDRLVIEGQETLTGGTCVDSYNDHRIAMMAAIAATGCQRPVSIRGAECVAKSYPNFWEDYRMLGGEIQCDM